MTLPELHLAGWRPTKDTLHLYCQIVGNIRLATTPPRNQWWNVPLYVDVRGLTTRRLHHNGTTFQGARLAGWETSGFESTWCPTPAQLHELQATAAYEFGRPSDAAAASSTRR
jgi:hypothetical protein